MGPRIQCLFWGTYVLRSLFWLLLDLLIWNPGSITDPPPHSKLFLVISVYYSEGAEIGCGSSFPLAGVVLLNSGFKALIFHPICFSPSSLCFLPLISKHNGCLGSFLPLEGQGSCSFGIQTTNPTFLVIPCSLFHDIIQSLLVKTGFPTLLYSSQRKFIWTRFQTSDPTSPHSIPPYSTSLQAISAFAHKFQCQSKSLIVP